MGRRGYKKSEGRSRNNNTNWTSIEKENEQWEAYYKEIGIISDSEWPSFKKYCQSALPLTFRITGSNRHAIEVRQAMEHDYIPFLNGLEWEGEPVEPPQAIKFYPDDLAWSLKVGKQVIRKNKPFARFQRFLVVETDVGNISRQEAVSMIPPLLLDVQPHHAVIDMCAAPGSKTAQLIEALHAKDPNAPVSKGISSHPTGFVIANDSDYKRSHMLIHQVKRLNSPNLVVTNHDAQLFPRIKQANGSYLKFDRVLCDVPCSGDGTMRKNVNVWKDWTLGNGLGLHPTQVNILVRGIQLLKPGGRLVYSTCSMNPIENEAVVAEALRQSQGSVSLVDVSKELPGLIRSPGMTTWKVQGKDRKWREPGEPGVIASAFPHEGDDTLGLERCVRVYPHQQDTGGFFIAVLEKKEEKDGVSEPGVDASKDSAETKKRSAEEQSIEKVKKVKTDESTGEQEVQKTAQPLEPKKQKLPRDANEEPFKFLAADHPTVLSCWKFYGISPEFPSNSLLVRNASGDPVRTIYYVAPSLRPLIELNESRIKFIHAGIKMFAQQKNEGYCKWRVQSEGIELLYPFVGPQRVVSIDKLDTLKSLCLQSFPKFAELEALDVDFKDQVLKIDEGCAFLKVDRGLDKETLVFPLWRGKGSVNLMLGKEDTQELLHRVFGVENLKGSENKENGNSTATDSTGVTLETPTDADTAAVQTPAEGPDSSVEASAHISNQSAAETPAETAAETATETSAETPAETAAVEIS